MIERSEVDGRPATLFWIMDDFDPADRGDATLCKVVYDDGDVAFVAVNVDEDEPAEDAFNEADHPRGQPGNAGEFGPGAGSKKKTDAEQKGGRDFKTYANGRNDLRELTDAVQGGELNDGLGDAQEKRWVLAGYSGSTASWDINHALRGGEKLPPVRQRTVDALDIAMKESSLSEDIAVWRALAYKGEMSPEVKKLMDGLKPGDTFVDKGFVSTSAIQHRPNAEVMKILAPKGSKALIANGTFIGYDGENEVVLDRGGRYEYVGDEGGSKVFRLHQGTEIAGDDASWNESAHPRGQPENAGEFARSGGGGGKSETKPDIRKSMNKVTEVAASTQPVKSLDELYDRAKAEEPAFRKMVEDIAEVTGSKPKFGVDKQTGSILKTRESSERKLRDELGGDFTKLRDVLRGTVVGDSVEKTRDAAATFVAKQGDNILRVKDRHVGPTSSGYRDILVNFRTPGGLVAELQFNSKAMTEAKEASGHKLYDSIRTGELAGKTFDELQAAARAIYEKAYIDDGDGHWEMGQ